MKCQSDIEKLAENKFKEAECLFNNKFPDGAYYLAGYAVELLLKAKVCKTLGIDNFFEESSLKRLKHPQTFKNHDLGQLLVLSGLYPDFEKKIKEPTFKAFWSDVIEWSEETRYLTGKSLKEGQDFLTSVKEITTWIKSYL